MNIDDLSLQQHLELLHGCGVLKADTTSVGDFNGLIDATKQEQSFATVIDGHKVAIIHNPLGRNIYVLFINGRKSNSGSGGHLRNGKTVNAI